MITPFAIHETNGRYTKHALEDTPNFRENFLKLKRKAIGERCGEVSCQDYVEIRSSKTKIWPKRIQLLEEKAREMVLVRLKDDEVAGK